MTAEPITSADDAAPRPLDANVIEVPSAPGACSAALGLRLSREGILWLAVAIVMFTAGLVKGINLLILLAYLLIGLWIVNWWFVRRDLKRLRGKRLPPGPIFAGVATEVRLELSVEGSRSVRGAIFEERGPEHCRRWIVFRLAADGPTRICDERCFTRRGRHDVGPLCAASRFPFGLVGKAVELVPAEKWLVLPRLGRFHVERFKHWLARSIRGDGRLRRRQLHTAVHEADIHGLRDFRPGDNPRWIHWRSSARRNQILVREFEDVAPPELALVIEAWLPEPATAADEARLERLFNLAATLCWEWCRDPFGRLTLIISGAKLVAMPTGSGMPYALSALEQLAVAEGGPARPAADWFDGAPRLRSMTPLLVLTSQASSPLARQIEALTGRPASQVDADDRLLWYEPPLAPALSRTEIPAPSEQITRFPAG